MTDYSFMKSGNIQENENEIDYTFITSLITLFMEDSIKMGLVYSKHANRNTLTEQDCKLALMARSYYGDQFWKLPNVIDRLNEIKEWLQSSEETDSEDDDIIIDETETFSQSSCNCIICSKMNNVSQHWDNWNPDNPMEIILKNSVNKTLK